MSRFRHDEREKTAEEVLPTPQPKVNLVPISAEEFARQRRQKFLKWGSAATIAALVLLSFLYRSSIPSAALNNYQDAKKLYENGKYTDALTALEPATHDKSKRLEAYQLRAAIYRAMYQPKDAIPDLDRVIKLKPEDPQNYRIRAQTYMELDNPASALPDYTKMIEMEHSAAAYNDRGLCYLKLNQPNKAVEDFTNAIEREPSMPNYLQRGLAWANAGDPHKAIADFNRAIEIRPDLSAGYRARANAEQQLGDRAAADRDRQKAFGMERPLMPAAKQVVLPTQ